jgi:hypothetical protein
MNQGTIVQCIGAVIDEFAREALPGIYDADACQ